MVKDYVLHCNLGWTDRRETLLVAERYLFVCECTVPAVGLQLGNQS